MAIHKGIRIHQYLDDLLVRATSHQVCLQHTQDLVKICQELDWLVNLEKSELEPKQIFNFVGYQFDLRTGRVRPTPDWWQNLQDKIAEILSLLACPVRQSLIGLLTATEKQVHLGRLHSRPIQWHLQNNWRVPESLEKVIPGPCTPTYNGGYRKTNTPSGECTSTRDWPASGNTGRLFLTFGGPVCTDRISNCPLDRVLTYNLIYLLNLQCDLHWFLPHSP